LKTALTLIFFALAAMAEEKLPDGPGKATVEKVCGECHGPEVIIGMTHDRQGWQELVDDMVVRGATPTKAEIKEIVDYLVRTYPKRDKKP